MVQIQELKNFIGGKWVASETDKFEEVTNPATKEVIARVPLSTKADVDYAVEVAQAAFEKWKNVAVPKRARILFKYQNLVVEHKEELAKIITVENGKNLSEALGEVQRGIENIEFAAGAPSLYMGDSLASIATDVEATNYRYPIGVVAGITPFNFPMMVPCWMFPMAVVLGNSFVLKPSEKTPLLTARLIELFQQAGLPDGVLNMVYGAHDVVNRLGDHPDVKALSFVGSKPVGEYVYKLGSENLKRVQALTGAKNHTIVLKDADLPESVKNIVSAAFGSAGERCMACAVVAVEEEVADAFIAELKKQTAEMTIWKDEIFAPVLSIVRVKDLKEGIAIANESEFANGACLFTNNASAVRYFRENIDAGMLGINLGVPAPMAFFPFSGWKSSFFGTLHANGKDSIDFYTRKKVVTARYPKSYI